jgi:thiol-disulfide isomerase/thioredoxin
MFSKTHSSIRAALRIVVLLLWTAGFVFAQQTASKDLGQSIDPFQASSGKPVVLIFLSTDCPISNRYAPTIQALAVKYESKAAFWLVYPAKAESPTAISARVQEYGYHLPWLRDPDHVLVRKAQATITPEAAVFDTDGKLQYHGRIDDLYQSISRSRRSPTQHDVELALDEILAHKPVTNHSQPAIGCYLSDLQ